MTSFIIGIAGASGVGKSTSAKVLLNHFANQAVYFPADNYFKNHDQLVDGNFDSPDAIDWELLSLHLTQLRANNPISAPVYDFVTSSRTKETIQIAPKPIIILDGLLVLYPELIRMLIDIPIFIDADQSVCLGRRSDRDSKERGRSIEDTEKQWPAVFECYKKFVEPTARYAFFQLTNNSKSVEFDMSQVICDIEQIMKDRNEKIPTAVARRHYSLFAEKRIGELDATQCLSLPQNIH